MSMYSIDVPNPHDPGEPWVNCGIYETRELAATAASHLFGADKDGNINIISEINDEE